MVESYIIKIKAIGNSYTKEAEINLSDVISRLGIITENSTSYNAPENNQHAASGGQILPSQPIFKFNTHLKSEVSINVRLRHDLTDPPEERWNIDIYIDIHDIGLGWHDRRLSTRHIKKIHHLPDSQYVVLEWSINGEKQAQITANRQA